MQASGEIVDGYEYIVHAGMTLSDLQAMMEKHPVAGKSSPRLSRATVVKQEPGVVEKKHGAGIGEEISAAAGSQASVFVVAGEVLEFAHRLMETFGLSDIKLSIASKGLVSDRIFSVVPPPRNVATPRGTEAVSASDNAAKVRISESKNEIVVSFVRQSPLGDTSHLPTGDSDLKLSIKKEDLAEKPHLEALEKADQPCNIPVKKVQGFSNAKRKSLRKIFRDSGDKLGVSGSGKKSKLEKKSNSQEDLHLSKCKGGSAVEKIAEHEAICGYDLEWLEAPSSFLYCSKSQKAESADGRREKRRRGLGKKQKRESRRGRAVEEEQDERRREERGEKRDMLRLGRSIFTGQV
ncbi:hypothetical protein H6P81_009861 [Aristolochia fimbriata]|uniref:Uncharacterized protein n=1 Tax=Aristolochia fimbriata TaxID=158543 RepID=A0AAV7EQD4_ARIFI|nr:hypothetical protein H6P81_009861 [Aristolochia fimbriata]